MTSSSTRGSRWSGPDQLASLERLATKGASRPSWCADQLNITAIARDPVQWNKNWERALRRVYTENPANVFAKAVEHWRSALSARFQREMRDRVLKVQRGLRTFFSTKHGPTFSMMWLLLDGAERERHALNGFRFSLSGAVWGQDARMLCPDVTASALLKNGGKMLIRLLEILECFTGRQVEDVLFIAAPNWKDMVEHLGMGQDTYDCLLLVRVELISMVAHHISASVFYEFNSSHASELMVAARRLISEKYAIAIFVAFSGALFRERPVVRCQRCKMCAEELRISEREFKQCSRCRERLGGNVVYCSQKCQSADWPRHKLKCGRQLVAPPPGSAVDVLRSCMNAPEIMQMLIRGDPANITLNSIGLDIRDTPHSLALRRQLLVLERKPEIDYALFDPDGSRITGWMLSDPEERLVFRLLRRKATASDDARGAEALADVVIRGVGAAGPASFTREVLLAQFCAEYGDDLRARLCKFEQIWSGEPAFIFRMANWPWRRPEDGGRPAAGTRSWMGWM